MDARVKRFRQAAARQGSRGVGKRYPAALRQLAVAVAQERRGEPLSRIAKDLEVSTLSLQRWLEQDEPARFRRVAVDHEAESAREGCGALTLITPRGYRVEGLELENLTAVLRVLG